MFATIAMTLFLILLMFLVIMFIVYFDYILSIARVIIIFMHKFAKRSLLGTYGVSGRHCVSVVLIRCLPADTPYILGHVVDHECDTLVEFFVVHSPNEGQVGSSCE
jgi:hypothetical protein